MTDKISCNRLLALPVALMLALLFAGPGQAGEAGDHDRARQALAAGEIMPLRSILEQIERDHPGQIMEVELERGDAGWRYEIKLLRAGGVLEKLLVDARDGKVLGIRNKNAARARHGGER